MDAEIRNARIAAARDSMRVLGVDLLAISPSDDLRYLLGFTPTADERPCMLLLDGDSSVFVIPSLNAAQARDAVPELELVGWDDADGAREALGRALAGFGHTDGRVAVDATMRADALLLLQDLLPAAYVDGADVLGPLRMQKSAEELARLHASAKTADVAMEAAFAACRRGTTELEVAQAAAAAFIREGCEESSFAIVGSGRNGAFPHHHSGRRELQDGNAVVIDIGSKLAGYASDITRMVHVGPPTARYRTVHDAVERAVLAALATAVPGATCANVDAAARAVIEEAGFGTYFTHRTGHGLGLSGHEPPSIMANESTVLEPGMVFSIEPGIYLPEEFGVRLEEIVAMTENGCVVLSRLRRDVFVLD
jgi:Xaa-Pro aminopeptidase